MPFVNVESGGYRFRVILGNHLRPSDPSQLSSECTGVTFEANVNTELLASSIIQGTSVSADYPQMRMYQAIREVAMRKSIPIAMAEPLIAEAMRDYLLAELTKTGLFVRSLFPHPRKTIEDTFFVHKASTDNHEIPIGSPTYERLKGLVEEYRSLHPGALVTERDYLMAQRSYALARYQKRYRVKQPDINIVTASFHIGIVESLMLSPEERSKYIKESPEISTCYQIDTLDKIFCEVYHPWFKYWTMRAPTDPYLKR